MATCMVASSVDSLQTGLVSVLSKQILKKELSPMASTGIGQLFVLAVNVPAIIFAAKAADDVLLGVKILDLFMIADIIAITLVVPIFAGLWQFVTAEGTLLGMWSGILVIMAVGWYEFGTFMAGLEMLTLMTFGNVQPPEKGLSANRTCILFFVLPIITGVVTFVVSWMQHVLQSLEKLVQGKAEETVI